MKTLTIIPVLLAALLMLVYNAYANDDKYLLAMKKNIQVVYEMKSREEVVQAVHAFERIGAAEKTKWEPYYYSAFGYIMLANTDKDGAAKDSLLDLASAALDKAYTLAPRESELAALRGFLDMIRVTVDPATRGPQYAGAAMQHFGTAVALNPENPRAYALMAQMQYGTAQFFGSSTSEACGTLTRALEKFDTFKSSNPLAPAWGKGMAEALREQCK